MKDNRDIISSYNGIKAGVKEFQKKSVKSLAEKFYLNGKEKLVLADEVGMGKTYVCRGLIELGKELKEGGCFTTLYIAPNEYVSKQNLSELCKGFVLDSKKVYKNKRLSELGLKSKKEGYQILSFSAGMFFNINASTTGTGEERIQICKYITNAIKILNNELEYTKEISNWIGWLEMLWSSMANAGKSGSNSCRYYYYDGNTKLPKEEYINEFSKSYLDFRNGCILENGLTVEEAKIIYRILREECNLSDENYLSCINKVYGAIKQQGKFEEIISNCYSLERKLHEKLRGAIHQTEFTEKELSYVKEVMNLMIPYYTNDGGEVYNGWSNKFFQKLREVANRRNFQKLQPDFIILDEFHKYFSGDVREKIDRYLEDVPNVKLLLVSATPYKMSLKSVALMSTEIDMADLDDTDEASGQKKRIEYGLDTCFSGYAELYEYISRDVDGAKEIQSHFEKIVNGFKSLKTADKETFEKIWELCKTSKQQIQEKVRDYIVRTERATLLCEKNTETIIYSDFNEEEMKFDCDMVHKMVQGEIGINTAVFYAKMAPFPMSFSEGYETLGYEKSAQDNHKFMENLARFDNAVFWDGSTMPNHFRLNKLCDAFLWDDNVKKALWIPPTGSKKLEGFWKELGGLSKVVVFAGHIMTIKSIAAIISSQMKRSENGTLEEGVFTTPPEEDFNKIIDGIEKGSTDYQGEPCVCFYKILKPLSENETMVRRKAREYGAAFYEYMKENKSVLEYAGVHDSQSLYEYCKNGDLEGVIEEYVFLLIKDKENIWEKLDIFSKVLSSKERGRVSFYKKSNSKDVTKENVHCSMADLYGEETGNKDFIKEAFNSPFYPFILATTPIAQEGLNFQNYADKTFHWRNPVSPIDYEQREGRVNRYRNVSVRKALKRKYGEGEWKDIFEKESEFVKNVGKEYGGLNPDWITTIEGGKIYSYMISHKESRESKVVDIILRAVDNYRVSLGYGVSNDVVSKIRENAETLGVSCEFKEILLDLSPTECVVAEV